MNITKAETQRWDDSLVVSRRKGEEDGIKGTNIWRKKKI